MTVPTTVNKVTYTGDGAHATYAYGFRIFQDADLQLTQVTDTGVVSVLTLTTDYTVTGAQSYTGGTIVLAANLPTGYTLTIFRNPSPVQLADLQNQGAYYADQVEGIVDLACMTVQALSGQSGLSLQVPPNESALPLLPSAADRANGYLGFNGSGAPVVLPGTTSAARTVWHFTESLAGWRPPYLGFYVAEAQGCGGGRGGNADAGANLGSGGYAGSYVRVVLPQVTNGSTAFDILLSSPAGGGLAGNDGGVGVDGTDGLPGGGCTVQSTDVSPTTYAYAQGGDGGVHAVVGVNGYDANGYAICSQSVSSFAFATAQPNGFHGAWHAPDLVVTPPPPGGGGTNGVTVPGNAEGQGVSGYVTITYLGLTQN